MVYAPGFVAWAINGYAFKRDQKTMLKILTAAYGNLPVKAATALLAKKVPYTVDENDAVVFTVE
jgi:hypothetical protein